jgi:CrcB protein
MKTLMLVFIGGGLGSLLRYAVHRLFVWRGAVELPYSTFMVNIIGCFIIGFAIFYTERLGDQAIPWRLFLVTGLCGGFTTFSSFAYENTLLLGDQRLFVFFMYITASIVLGVLATYLGIVTARNI